MGQYYNVILKKEKGKHVVYDRDLIINKKREYTLAKIMEHSWWLNEFVNAISEKIYQKPQKVVWVGDYACDLKQYCPDSPVSLTSEKIEELYTLARNKDIKTLAVHPTEFTLDDLYVCNHTKKEYIDCTKYFRKSAMDYNGDKWCIHPLPLLTCVGNGLGGGDYRSPTEESTIELVGYWAYDLISVEDTVPNDYLEIEPLFKEKGWED